ncbi:hypothetical protein D9V84_01315 [Bacteroidetes/Chlorobi group bacterium Naka2016]|jgi:ABC-type uncharacterized transport system auxiliary subunit|nr:MAG: hypothetical protein D9V84_01315 [Bacteroidetes/Chlorobi group bacterium Naka2016]
MKRLLLTITLSVALSGCFSIRTPFIPTNYYYLNQEPLSFKNIAQIETFLVIRDFAVPEELFDNRLMIWFDDGTVQKFNYHRFNSDYADIINNFIFSRMNLSKAFKFGVASFNSAIVPNFILEGKVLEFKALAEKKDKKKNWVQVSIQINLIKYEPISTNKPVVLSQIYSQRIDFEEREYTRIAKSFSKALSLIVDKMILDIQSAIAHYSEE